MIDPLYPSKIQDDLEAHFCFSIDQILKAFGSRTIAAQRFNQAISSLKELIANEQLSINLLVKSPTFENLVLSIGRLVRSYNSDVPEEELNILRLSVLVRMLHLLFGKEQTTEQEFTQASIGNAMKKLTAATLTLDSPVGQKLLDTIFGYPHKELLRVFTARPQMQEQLEKALSQFLTVFQDSLHQDKHDQLEMIMNSVEFHRFKQLGRRIIEAQRAILKNGMELPKTADKLTNKVYFLLQKVA